MASVDLNLGDMRCFTRPSCGDKRLIRAKHLVRGDMIRVLSSDYIIRGKEDGVIKYVSFYFDKRLHGGGGDAAHCFGFNSQEIVEYIGCYKYKNGMRSKNVPDHLKNHIA